MTMHKALHSIDDSNRLYVSRIKKEEENLPAFKIALMYRYKESKIILTAQDLLQPSETRQTIQTSTK